MSCRSSRDKVIHTPNDTNGHYDTSSDIVDVDFTLVAELERALAVLLAEGVFVDLGVLW